MTPRPVRTCQRHTADTTFSQSLHQTRDHPALGDSIPGLNVSPQPITAQTVPLSDTVCTEAPAFLQSLMRRGVRRKREGISPEETGSCGSGSIGSLTGSAGRRNGRGIEKALELITSDGVY
ncbi:hypothetical protein PBY51_013744 [Eleginops maclovinus]|uniref:Uncharacterized protein n=1 Tax=Eleginops maclovinus TaxID=56733 RepID=A0AAN7Y8V6_ELEMC|nr:hypothetical protein PBY51_013744 [Eleginops maclovinus]